MLGKNHRGTDTRANTESTSQLQLEARTSLYCVLQYIFPRITKTVVPQIHFGQRGADGHVGRQGLCHRRGDALLFDIPLLDVVLRVVAKGVEDGAPALVTEAVAPQVDAGRQRGDDENLEKQAHTQK